MEGVCWWSLLCEIPSPFLVIHGLSKLRWRGYFWRPNLMNLFCEVRWERKKKRIERVYEVGKRKLLNKQYQESKQTFPIRLYMYTWMTISKLCPRDHNSFPPQPKTEIMFVISVGVVLSHREKKKKKKKKSKVPTNLGIGNLEGPLSVLPERGRD